MIQTFSYSVWFGFCDSWSEPSCNQQLAVQPIESKALTYRDIIHDENILIKAFIYTLNHWQYIQHFLKNSSNFVWYKNTVSVETMYMYEWKNAQTCPSNFIRGND